MNAHVDIVIVNWNSGVLLRQCLASISGESAGAVLGKVIVVDNASQDDSCDDLPTSDFPLSVIKNTRNLGFATACNQGARQATNAYLLFLNPDTRLLADSLTGPVQFMEQPDNSRIGICGIQLLDAQGQVSRSCARFPSLHNISAKIFGVAHFFPRAGMTMLEWNHQESRPVDQVMGAFFLVRRSVFEALHGFDECFFVYFEDVDFSLRARLAGWCSYYLTSAQACHWGGGTTGKIKGTRLFYFLRSRIFYFCKHFPGAGAGLHLLATLLLEPFSRLMFALLRGRAAEIRDVGHGFFLLWRDIPRLLVMLRRLGNRP